MEIPRAVKDLIYPARGDLVRLRFREAGEWLSAFVPDDEAFGLSRELILQRIYDAAGPVTGGTVVDAGAHVGLFSLIASRHAERVIALEPDPFNHRVLALNRDLNGAQNLICRQAALWSEDGEVRFRGSWHSTGGAVRGDGEPVAAVSLDSLVDEHGDVDLLKLDIEGAEREVIAASRRLGSIRRIVGELHGYGRADFEPLLATLRSAGFDVRLIPAPDLYAPRQAGAVIRNLRALEGRAKIKLGVLAYLLAPVEKPRRPPGSRDMPLLVAERAGEVQ